MSAIIVSRELYSPLARVLALQGDLCTAPAYWPHLLACDAEEAHPDRLAIRYKLGRHVVSAVAQVERMDRQRLVVLLEGGVRGSIAADYAATAMTRTSVTLHLDLRVHRGLLGEAADWLFSDEQLAADAATALERLGALTGAETSEVLTRVREGIDAHHRGDAVATSLRILDESGNEVLRCAGPDPDGQCSQAAGEIPCAGCALVPADGHVSDGWALEVKAQASECPLAWMVPKVRLTA